MVIVSFNLIIALFNNFISVTGFYLNIQTNVGYKEIDTVPKYSSIINFCSFLMSGIIYSPSSQGFGKELPSKDSGASISLFSYQCYLLTVFCVFFKLFFPN